MEYLFLGCSVFSTMNTGNLYKSGEKITSETETAEEVENAGIERVFTLVFQTIR